MNRTLMVSAFCVFAAVSANAGRHVTFSMPTKDIAEFDAFAARAKAFGADHVWATEIEPALWLWNLSGRKDPYPNWGLKNATVFKFVVPDELKEWLPADYAKRNLDVLKARAAVLRKYGLKARFNAMEPAYLPEAVYRAHPAWRGPRCDQARRARGEYYAPCFDNPEVRAMYFKAVKELCTACPFDAFSFLTNDSGGGLCWAEGLYPGENGPAECHGTSIGERIAMYLGVFQDAAAAAGLKDVQAGVFHIGDADMRAAIPVLREGQTVNGRNREGAAKSMGCGYGQYGENTFPVYNLPRLAGYASAMQGMEAASKDVNLNFSFRAGDDEAIEFVTKYFGKIGQGMAARWTALERFAAEKVGAEDAAELADIWNRIQLIVELFDPYETGGHIFMLGSVHQRWLTRPFVAYPEELKSEEKDYYRAYQFQAQEEANADDLCDLQAHRWLNGYGSQFLITHTSRLALGHLERALATAEKLAKKHEGGAYAKNLRLLAMRLRAYRFVINNAVNAVAFQTIMDRHDRTKTAKDVSPEIRLQGDTDLVTVNEIVRNEIDASYAIAELIEKAEGPLFVTAPSMEFTCVMALEPDLPASLRKRAAIMENHRRDFLRFMKSRNR